MRFVLAVFVAGTSMASGSADTNHQGEPMSNSLELHVGQSNSDAQTAWLTIADIEGSYTVPYVQTSRNLSVALSFDVPGVASSTVAIVRDGATLGEQIVAPPGFQTSFRDLLPGEYTLQVRGVDESGNVLCQAVYERVGVGVVIAAIGDSITEGYFGRGFFKDDLHLRSDDFPADAVSRDRRNFPQFAPTTETHLPSVNCFESWMTRLNDDLSESWKQPILIANEGWGGITSAGYLAMMRNDDGWRKRVADLNPQLWLIHLGVNDERAHVPATDYARNMAAIVDLLIKEFGATPDGIFIARPSYDYFEGAPEILATYCDRIDRLVAERGLPQGPDFFTLFATDRQRWYGEDPVHPNVEGMNRMAKAWHDALVTAQPDGLRQ